MEIFIFNETFTNAVLTLIASLRIIYDRLSFYGRLSYLLMGGVSVPTGTFFRLPEEKRNRLTEAAWNEFTRAKFVDTSINRIIQEAGIPRGSFYQYFEDKEDVLRHLLSEVGEHFFAMFDSVLKNAEGDLDKAAVALYGRILNEDGRVDPKLDRFLKLMCINPGFDLQQIVSARPELLQEIFSRNLNMSRVRSADEHYVRRVCQLYIKMIASAIMDTLSGLVQREEACRALMTDLEILKYGILQVREPAAAAAGRALI